LNTVRQSVIVARPAEAMFRLGDETLVDQFVKRAESVP